VIRAGTEGDAPLILAVILRAFEEYRGTLDPPSGAHNETRESISEKIGQGGAAVALAGSEVVGCALWKEEPGYLYLGRLAVLPEFRRAGIGGRLVEWIEEEAARLGAPKVQLKVRSALSATQEYYERRGYRVTGQGSHPGYTGPTYVVMEKALR